MTIRVTPSNQTNANVAQPPSAVFDRQVEVSRSPTKDLPPSAEHSRGRLCHKGRITAGGGCATKAESQPGAAVPQRQNHSRGRPCHIELHSNSPVAAIESPTW